MPNWCENDLRVFGPQADLIACMNYVEGESHFDFDRIIPYPEEFRKADEIAEQWAERLKQNGGVTTEEWPVDGYNSGGYEWCVATWGTKWPACHVVRDAVTDGDEADTQAVVYHFNTAWSPPKPVIQRLAELFPTLTFTLRYFESGCAYHGVLVCRGDEVILDKQGAYYGERGG